MMDVKRKLRVKVLFFFVVAFISFYIVISNVCQWLRAQIIIKKKKEKEKKKKKQLGLLLMVCLAKLIVNTLSFRPRFIPNHRVRNPQDNRAPYFWLVLPHGNCLIAALIKPRYQSAD